MPKPRNHNEWFRIVYLDGRKSCPNCKAKLIEGESVWSWGEYVIGKWRTVKYFCASCFNTEVKAPLIEHATPCGCNITLNICEVVKPKWLKL